MDGPATADNEVVAQTFTRAEPMRPVDARGDSSVSISCRNVGVSLLGEAGLVDILTDINLDIAAGSFVSVLGTSGAGKTTFLRCIGGLQPSSAGSVVCAGETVDGPPRGAVTVFQDYASSLLPWRTVGRNVALGIEKGTSRAEQMEVVSRSLESVGLDSYINEYPRRLSGGMQQRVQIARALAMGPSILLMDEPFGALDAMTKSELQDQLQEVHLTHKTTIIFVTHDVDEAVYLSDRIIILEGRPATIGQDIEVNLPRPRDQLETKESPEYLALRHQIFRSIAPRTRR